jgi:predicted DNA-binding mobile mystery protein A
VSRAPVRPPDGSIKATREALGMSLRQLAKRMGLTTASAAGLEEREVSSSITLRSLSRAAEALNCRLVYALVPKESLEAVVRRQAELAADRILSRVNATMALEDQSSDSETRNQQRDDLVDELVRTTPRDLWDLA